MHVMKKRLVILALLLLVACAQIGQYVQQEEEAEEGALIGTEGLHLEFMQNTPPPVMYGPEDGIPIMLIAENKGTHNNMTGYVALSGFDPQVMTVYKDRPGDALKDAATYTLPAIPGRGPFQPRGQTAILEYNANIASPRAFGADKYRTILLATSCYEYQTHMSTELCVDFNPYAVARTQKICTPQDITLQGGQGAPIGITNVEIEPGTGITNLIIHLRNLGTGDVFDSNALEKCNPYSSDRLQYGESDYVNIEQIRISNQDITTSCQPQGRVRLTNGEGLIYCTVTEGPFEAIQTAFVSPLSIKLAYGYRDSITRPIEIRPAG